MSGLRGEAQFRSHDHDITLPEDGLAVNLVSLFRQIDKVSDIDATWLDIETTQRWNSTLISVPDGRRDDDSDFYPPHCVLQRSAPKLFDKLTDVVLDDRFNARLKKADQLALLLN